jgi:hypothetical protein
LEKAWNKELKSFSKVWGGKDVDAFLLLLPQLNFLPASDERYKKKKKKKKKKEEIFRKENKNLTKWTDS